ncbi:MAG: hypothetical protein F7B20_02540 [Aeropyrum sp.]|nr:hypothetical protein [Aeropyrum sp.]MCE4616217.1 hypothetical protein [Aeropyrum sp.]
MLLKNEQQVKVDIDNSRVTVSGRKYEASHSLLIGSSRLEAEIESGSVRVRAYFAKHPEVEYVNEDLVKIYSVGSKYEVDTFGEKISKIEESSGVITLEGEVLSLKFEIDSEFVTVKLPKGTRVKATRLIVTAEGDVSLNIITFPFTMGILTARRSRARIVLKGDVVETRLEPS